MKVKRIVPINTIEPQPISMRVPAKVPLTIDFQYINMSGEPIGTDVVCQLQVSPRSGGQTQIYPVPATDVLNGKARVAIPKGELVDMNGYRIRLVGTYRSDAWLFATGTISMIESAGIDDVPEDIVDFIPITIPYNFDYGLDLKLWQDTGKETPFDLTSATITSSIYSDQDATAVLASFVIGVLGPGHIVLQLPVAVVNTLPANCWWSLKASSAAGVTTLCEGPVSCYGTVVGGTL